MKHINLILSVLCWAVASVAMAVTLPSNSYSSFIDGSETFEFKISTGVRMSGSPMLTTGSIDVGVCTTEGVAKDIDTCTGCCDTQVGDPCMARYDDPDICGDLNIQCLDSCTSGSRSLPLGTPLCLLPFIAVYAVIRRRKQA